MSAVATVRRTSIVSSLFAAAFVCAAALFVTPAARADGELTRVFYPSQEEAAFTVDIPSGWEMKAQGEEGAEEYFEVGGPNGVELSFRTVPGGDVEAALEKHVAYLKENFSDIKVEEPAKATIGGMEAVLLPATGTDADGSVRDLGAGFFKISDSEAGELWYNVAKTDSAGGAAAVAVLNSIKKGS